MRAQSDGVGHFEQASTSGVGHVDQASTRKHLAVTAAAWLAATLAALPLPAQQAPLPSIRPLGTRVAITHDTIGVVFGIRQLSDGRVLVNDNAKRRLLLFDASLAHPIVVADTTSSTRKTYEGSAAGLLAFDGDSSLFVDAISLSLLVIDPAGAIGRVIAAPRAADAGSLVGGLGGRSAFDGRGGLVYRPTGTTITNGYAMMAGTIRAMPAGVFDTSSRPRYAIHDSAVVIRAGLVAHRIDTVGFIAIPFLSGRVTVPGPNGRPGPSQPTVLTPIQFHDDWALAADGSVAFVRGLDYHIDWVSPDGARTSTPRIAHDWHRLSDSEKVRILDSIKKRDDSTRMLAAAMNARLDSGRRAEGRVTASALAAAHAVTPQYPDPSDLPDYLPVFVAGGVLADADGNIWIRQAVLPPGAPPPAPVYDIVNREGRLIDRVQLPPSLTLVGFGPGVAYLTVREASGTVLAKYRIR